MATETASTVTITPLTEPDELHCRYRSHDPLQPTYLALDLEGGELTCRYNPEINGTPLSVFERRTLWIPIPVLTADAANRLMEDVTPLAQRILDGASIEWDSNNWVGHLDEDANAALDDLTAECDPQNGRWDPGSQVAEYDANDWFDTPTETIERLGLTADTTDAELEAFAEAEQAVAASTNSSDGYVIINGAENWLREIRDELRNELREELRETAVQIDALTDERDRLIRRLAAWGDPSRSIGKLIDMSHTRVQQIAKGDTK